MLYNEIFLLPRVFLGGSAYSKIGEKKTLDLEGLRGYRTVLANFSIT